MFCKHSVVDSISTHSTMRNSVEIGEVGRYTAIVKFIELGFNVSVPVCESLPYDLILEKENHFQKVQVKTTRPKRGVLSVNLRSSNNYVSNNKTRRKYTSKEIDVFVVVDYITKRIYWIDMTSGRYDGMSTLSLRVDAVKKHSGCAVRLAKDFEI